MSSLLPCLIGLLIAAVFVIFFVVRRSRNGSGLGSEEDFRERYAEDLAFMEKTLGIDLDDNIEYVKAVISLQESQGVSFREHYSQNDEMARSFWQNVGQSYAADGNYGRASECFGKALEFYLKGESEEYDVIASLRCELGVALGEIGAYDEALEHFKESLKFHTENQALETPEMAILLHNIGWVLHGNGEDEIAIAYYRQSLALCEQLGLADGIEMVREKMQGMG